MANEIYIVIVLIMLNGLFAVSEMSIVSSRKPRLKVMAENGRRGAKVALRLAENPGRFLSMIQVGITLIGVLAGAYSGAKLAIPMGDFLISVGLLNDNAGAHEFALTLVVVIITFATILFGELLPKRFALTSPEKIACVVAVPVDFLSMLFKPAIWFLDCCTRLVFALMKVQQHSESEVTEEEVRALIAEGTESGVFEHQEKRLIDGVLNLADRTVKAIMIPRQDIVWIDATENLGNIVAKVSKHKHSRYVVCSGTLEKPVGVLATRDLLAVINAQDFDLLSVINKSPPAISEDLSILEALDIFRKSSANLALVVDEYGALEGVVGLKDLMMAIVGILPEHASRPQPRITQRDAGSWLIDGMTEIQNVEEILGLKDMVGDDDYVTLAGFILAKLGEIPEEGQWLIWNGYRFEIVDMDGKRIDKVLVEITESDEQE